VLAPGGSLAAVARSRRREPTRALLLALAVASAVAAALPAGATAQGDGAAQGRPRVVAFLGSSAREVAAFRRGMADVGLTEGPALAVEPRLTEGRLERYGPLAKGLAERPPAVAVAVGEVAALILKHHLPGTPVVFVGVPDPVGSGLARSLGSPGGQLTGITSSAPDLLVRQLELLKEAVPRVGRVAIVWNPSSPGKTVEVDRARAAAPGLGIELFSIPVHRPSDLIRVPQGLDGSRADAMVALADAVIDAHGVALAQHAAARRIPAVFQDPKGADHGALIGYGAPLGPQIRRAAFFVDRILKGESPARLPVEPPARLELAINMTTARALEIEVPPALELRADRVVGRPARP
jgi:putative ABC transport system substrate-binding protein